MAMVALADPDRRTIRAVAAEGELQRFFEEEVPEQAITEAFLQGAATGRAFATGRTVVVEDYAAWPVVADGQARTVAAGVRALVVAPLRVGGATIGVLWVGDTQVRRFDPDDVQLMEALANQAALAIEHARLEQRSHEAVVLEERARLARDLHDSVTQSLFSLGMLARAAQAQLEKGAPALSGTLERISTLAQQALTEMRALLFELRPSVLAEEGLAAALERLTASCRARFDLPVRFVGSVEADVRLPMEVETAVFRIAQEALNNAAKHANATEVVVTMTVAERQLCVTVEDNGRGFDVEAVRAGARAGSDGGLGLRTMRERATAAGITLRITSTPGRGTRVWIAAPLPVEEATAEKR
jgi:signal transduction histidine kinase